MERGTATMINEADTSIFLVNRQFERLSGYDKAEIEGAGNHPEETQGSPDPGAQRIHSHLCRL